MLKNFLIILPICICILSPNINHSNIDFGWPEELAYVDLMYGYKGFYKFSNLLTNIFVGSSMSFALYFFFKKINLTKAEVSNNK